MGVPFQRPVEGMEDIDETGDKVFTFIQFTEHPGDDATDRLEKAVKQGVVITVFVAAGGTELRMAAQRDEFQFAAVRTSIHGITIRECHSLGRPSCSDFAQSVF